MRRHGGALKDLSVCVNRFHPEELVDFNTTLEVKPTLETSGVLASSPLVSSVFFQDSGVVGGECVVYYDFTPVCGALLD